MGNSKNMESIIKEKKEVRIISAKPLVRNWDLLVRCKDMEECVRRLRVFADYWQDLGAVKLDMPEDILLRGNVYGRKGFTDGMRINTSWVKTLERVEQQYRGGVPHDLICATTYSGSMYYFYSDECLPEMQLLIGQLIHTVPKE